VSFSLLIRPPSISVDTHIPPSHPTHIRTQVYLQEDTFHGYKLDCPKNEVQVTKKQLVEMYKTMTEMRRMEMAADKLYKEKLIRGFCHLAIGQEAVSVGMESAIEADDKVITSYRCHPFAVLRGGTVKGVIAELLGECLLSQVDGTAVGLVRLVLTRMALHRSRGRHVSRQGWLYAHFHKVLLWW